MTDHQDVFGTPVPGAAPGVPAAAAPGLPPAAVPGAPGPAGDTAAAAVPQAAPGTAPGVPAGAIPRAVPGVPPAVAPDAPAGGPAGPAGDPAAAERLRRWRLVLGGDADGTGHTPTGTDRDVDRALAALYDGPPRPGAPRAPGTHGGGRRGAGLGASAPSVARWLGDIRRHFPSGVVQVLQQDALERHDLTRLLLEPELLAAVEPDVHLAATLVRLSGLMPESARDAARVVVGRVAADLERRLGTRTRTLVQGAVDRTARTRRPRRPGDIDWHATIRANLRHYQPGLRTVVPERVVGHGRSHHGLAKDLVLCVDQSASMGPSLVHAAVLASVLARVRALRTSLVVFDAAVADLTDRLADPVDVLLGPRLGGGTDIDRALAYCRTLVARPADTVVVLISDLYEAGDRDGMLRRVAAMRADGVTVVVLLALSDDGAPAYDRATAAALASLGCPAFACTPDRFAEVMAAALAGRAPTVGATA